MSPPRPSVPAGLALGPGREFDAIRRWIGAGRALPDEVRVGPGDDAAVLDGGWVVSTDLMVEGVHFRSAWLSPREVGFRAAGAALSDLAAMAARPVAVLVSMAGATGDGDLLDGVQQGVREAAARVGATVVGGDLSGSPGPLFVDLVALGRTDAPLLRSGARPGDAVWVTGALGAAAGAVRAWEEGRTPPEPLRAAFARPPARAAEARWLAEHAPVHALVDLSDGLAGDAGHLAAGGGVRVVLEAERIPVAADLAASSGGDEVALELALHGGEDYELLLATAPDGVPAARFRAETGVALTRVGRVEAGEGVWLDGPIGVRRVGRGGFDHLGSAGR